MKIRFEMTANETKAIRNVMAKFDLDQKDIDKVFASGETKTRACNSVCSEGKDGSFEGTVTINQNFVVDLVEFFGEAGVFIMSAIKGFMALVDGKMKILQERWGKTYEEEAQDLATSMANKPDAKLGTIIGIYKPDDKNKDNAVACGRYLKDIGDLLDFIIEKNKPMLFMISKGAGRDIVAVPVDY